MGRQCMCETWQWISRLESLVELTSLAFSGFVGDLFHLRMRPGANDHKIYIVVLRTYFSRTALTQLIRIFQSTGRETAAVWRG